MDEGTHAGAVRGREPGGGGFLHVYGSYLATQQAEVWSQTRTGVRESEFQNQSKMTQIPDPVLIGGKIEAQGGAETCPGPSASQ